MDASGRRERGDAGALGSMSSLFSSMQEPRFWAEGLGFSVRCLIYRKLQTPKKGTSLGVGFATFAGDEFNGRFGTLWPGNLNSFEVHG